jgi:hypothetical protein
MARSQSARADIAKSRYCVTSNSITIAQHFDHDRSTAFDRQRSSFDPKAATEILLAMKRQ